MSLALLRLMDALSPEDRAIYVLRHAFDVPYAEIAAVVARSEAACRQVVRRASARLAAVDVPSPDGSLRCLVLEVRDGLVRTVQLHGNTAKLGALDRPA